MFAFKDASWLLHLRQSYFCHLFPFQSHGHSCHLLPSYHLGQKLTIVGTWLYTDKELLLVSLSCKNALKVFVKYWFILFYFISRKSSRVSLHSLPTYKVEFQPAIVFVSSVGDSEYDLVLFHCVSHPGAGPRVLDSPDKLHHVWLP
jgi:hypothetical protein